jgi:hypothetical protein
MVVDYVEGWELDGEMVEVDGGGVELPVPPVHPYAWGVKSPGTSLLVWV